MSNTACTIEPDKKLAVEALIHFNQKLLPEELPETITLQSVFEHTWSHSIDADVDGLTINAVLLQNFIAHMTEILNTGDYFDYKEAFAAFYAMVKETLLFNDAEAATFIEKQLELSEQDWQIYMGDSTLLHFSEKK